MCVCVGGRAPPSPHTHTHPPQAPWTCGCAAACVWPLMMGGTRRTAGNLGNCRERAQHGRPAGSPDHGQPRRCAITSPPCHTDLRFAALLAQQVDGCSRLGWRSPRAVASPDAGAAWSANCSSSGAPRHRRQEVRRCCDPPSPAVGGRGLGRQGRQDRLGTAPLAPRLGPAHHGSCSRPQRHVLARVRALALWMGMHACARLHGGRRASCVHAGRAGGPPAGFQAQFCGDAKWSASQTLLWVSMWLRACAATAPSSCWARGGYATTTDDQQPNPPPPPGPPPHRACCTAGARGRASRTAGQARARGRGLLAARLGASAVGHLCRCVRGGGGSCGGSRPARYVNGVPRQHLAALSCTPQAPAPRQHMCTNLKTCEVEVASGLTRTHPAPMSSRWVTP